MISTLAQAPAQDCCCRAGTPPWKEGSGWEYAIWAEGWTSQVIQADPETLEPKEYTEATSGLKVFVDTARNAIVIRVPLKFLPEGDPATWGYAAAVMGQGRLSC